MARALVALILISLTACASVSQANEGLFAPGEIGTQFDQDAAGSAVWKLAYTGKDKLGRISTFSGSVFFIAENGTFVTNYHVLEEAIRPAANRGVLDPNQGYAFERGFVPIEIEAELSNGITNERIPIRKLSVIAISPQAPAIGEIGGLLQETQSDLMIVRVPATESSFKRFSTLKLSADPLRMGERVYALGYPGFTRRPKKVGFLGKSYRDADGSLRLSTGLVVPLTQSQNQSGLAQGRVIATHVDAVQGSSGGPILNSRGEVVGVNVAGKVDAGLLGLATDPAFVYSDRSKYHVSSTEILNRYGSNPQILPPEARVARPSNSITGAADSKCGARFSDLSKKNPR